MPEPSELSQDAARVMEMLEYYATDHSAGLCTYVDARRLLDGSDKRAQESLRALELDGSIIWLSSGVLFPNRFPWSRFARRAGPTLVRHDDPGPARGSSRNAASHVRRPAGERDRHA